MRWNRLSTRLALWMVMVTVLLQGLYGLWRYSSELQDARSQGYEKINKVVLSITPALSEALYQYNESLSIALLKTFDTFPEAQAIWLLDQEEEGVSAWLRKNQTAPEHWQEFRWPLYFEQEAIGTLAINLDMKIIAQQGMDRLLNQMLLSLLLGVLALLSLYWVAQIQVTKPIVRLSKDLAKIDTKAIQAADLAQFTPDSQSYEIQYLQRNIKKILSQLLQNLSDRQQAMVILQDFNVQLEKKVNERTQELAVAKDQAEIASHSKTDFMNSMTHELRTPLNSILGFSSLLAGRDLQPQHKMLVENIHRSGEHLLTLINDIIDYVELDAKALQCQGFSVFDVVHSCQQQFLAKAQHKGLQLELRVDQSLILLGDAKRLGIAIRHLIDNALKFTQQGSILISAEHTKEGQVEIHVIDSGSGIDLEKVDNLSESFVQHEQGLARSKEGVGLGLALVDRICSRWGGQLSFALVEPSGTDVCMRLPNMELD